MKKYFKLLCFVFITFFVIGFGGERVIAEEAPSKISVKKGSIWYQDATWNATVKVTNDDKYYAFCLDSDKHILIDTALPYDNSLYSNKKSKVAFVYSKAVEYGLGDGNNTHNITVNGKNYTVSETDLYGITQIAIWNAVHPTGNSGATAKYTTWLSNKGYTEIYNSIANNSTTKTYAVYFAPKDGGKITTTETEIDDKTYLVSNTFILNKIGVPDSVTYNLTVTGGEISINGGKSWTSNMISVRAGAEVMVRMEKPDDAEGDLQSKITATSTNFITGYNAYFYNASSIGNNYQNMGILIPTKSTRTAQQTVRGTYENDAEIEIQKADKITGKKVAGALIGVYNQSDNELITTVTTTAEGKDNPKVSLSVGKYYVKEIEPPTGYELDETHVLFEVVSEDGTLKIKNENGTEITTVTAVDERVKIKYRKVDTEGNPISGVRIEIHNYANKLSKLDDLYICAITDSDGYLTKPCDDISNPEKYYSSTGEYYFENNSGEIYYIHEEFKDGYYNPNFADDENDFAISPTEFLTIGDNVNYLYIDGELGKDAVVTLNIINERYINISKTDTGTGAELEGAEMHIYDAEARDCFVTSELGESCENAPFVEVDSWTSTTTPHTFVGIKADHRYILTETVAPTGYVRITTDVEFSIDKDGNVTVYSNNSTVSSDMYKLVIGNDYETIDVPNTGISTLNLLAIGGLMVFVGYETIKLYKKKANE